MIVGIIDLKLNNIFSINNAATKLGYNTKIITTPKEIDSCDALILPGTGSFHKAMYRLNKDRLTKAIKSFIENEKPFLGICLGMQLLFSKSYEFVTTDGIGVLEGDVVNIKSMGKILKAPHVGMNYLNLTKNQKKSKIDLFEKKKYYFNHSFIVHSEDDSISIAYTNYNNLKFCSVIKKKNILGTQFHPELSYSHGLKLLSCLKNL